MTFEALVAHFGGVEGLMAVTGAKRNAVNHWRTCGVPYRHWPTLIAAAQARRIKGITLEALEGTRPCRPSRAA